MDPILELLNEQPFWLWAGLGAALLAVEVATGSGWLLWASASAVATGVLVGVIDPPLPAAILVFAALTMASTLLARRYLPRSVAATGGDINDNIGRVVGHAGSAVGPFSGRQGRVFVDGKEWAAELDDDAGLEAGARIEVTGVDGARLRVRRA